MGMAFIKENLICHFLDFIGIITFSLIDYIDYICSQIDSTIVIEAIICADLFIVASVFLAWL